MALFSFLPIYAFVRSFAYNIIVSNIDSIVFGGTKSNSEPISRQQAYRIIKKAAENVGLTEHISCHSLRKTFGYHAWKQGTQPALLMSIYNHSSYEITMRYLCIAQDDKDKVFCNINL